MTEQARKLINGMELIQKSVWEAQKLPDRFKIGHLNYENETFSIMITYEDGRVAVLENCKARDMVQFFEGLDHMDLPLPDGRVLSDVDIKTLFLLWSFYRTQSVVFGTLIRGLAEEDGWKDLREVKEKAERATRGMEALKGRTTDQSS